MAPCRHLLPRPSNPPQRDTFVPYGTWTAFDDSGDLWQAPMTEQGQHPLRLHYRPCIQIVHEERQTYTSFVAFLQPANSLHLKRVARHIGRLTIKER